MIPQLVTLLVLVLFFCLICYALQTFLPLEQPFKNIIILILAIILIVWAFYVLGFKSIGTFLQDINHSAMLLTKQ